MTEVPDPREVSNSWYGRVTEGDLQSTPEGFQEFLERDVLPKVPPESRSGFLYELRRWIPEQGATIERIRGSRHHP